MKKFLLTILGCMSLHARGMTLDAARWRALGMLESGDNDYAVGTHGEVSRFQIMPQLWILNHGQRPADKTEALRIARLVWQENWRTAPVVDRRRKITNLQWALVWHCPARFNRPTKEDYAYAVRFCNLVHRYLKY